LMHTVIQSECTGCDKCAPVCPVDCIDMRPPSISIENWQWPEPGITPAAHPEKTSELIINSNLKLSDTDLISNEKPRKGDSK